MTCESSQVKKLLGYASALFLGGLLASIPVALALHGADDTQSVPKPSRWFVRIQLIIVALMISAAVICMLVVIWLFGQGGAFWVAMLILFATIVWCGCALLVDTLPYIIVGVQLLAAVIVIVFGAAIPSDEKGFAISNHTMCSNLTPTPEMGWYASPFLF